MCRLQSIQATLMACCYSSLVQSAQLTSRLRTSLAALRSLQAPVQTCSRWTARLVSSAEPPDWLRKSAQ